MEQSDEVQKLKELAQQLSCPDGKKGLEIADMMHGSNIGMTLKAIESLHLLVEERVLEIGHGNANHLKHVFEKAEHLNYTGLDISGLMNREAQKNNSEYVKKGNATFHLYDGLKVSFDDNYFDKIFTVNTLYFWQKPIEFLWEIHRVLKPDGLFSIAFAQRDFMEKLPFVKYGFQLYNINDLEKLVEKTDFEIVQTLTETEMVETKTGELVERAFTVMVLKK